MSPEEERPTSPKLMRNKNFFTMILPYAYAPRRQHEHLPHAQLVRVFHIRLIGFIEPAPLILVLVDPLGDGHQGVAFLHLIGKRLRRRAIGLGRGLAHEAL